MTEINLTIAKMNTAISETNAAAENAKTQTEAALEAEKGALRAAAAAEALAERLGNMEIQAQVREYGSGSTAELTDDGEKAVLALGLERGAPGAKGEKGDKGDKGDVGPVGATFKLSGGILYITTA